MTSEKITLGKAIDQIVGALTALEKKEQQTAIATVCTVLDLSPIGFTGQMLQPSGHHDQGQLPAPHPIAPAALPKTGGHEYQHGIDIRTLKDQKQPDSARQMACVVAYYLLEYAPEAERKLTITAADLETYFKQAKYKLPTKLEQLLVDCKGAGYFETVARGEYKLTRVGYNLVTHSMPKSGKG